MTVPLLLIYSLDLTSVDARWYSRSKLVMASASHWPSSRGQLQQSAGLQSHYQRLPCVSHLCPHAQHHLQWTVLVVPLLLNSCLQDSAGWRDLADWRQQMP